MTQAIRAELEALRKIVDTLEPLAPHERARVLLIVTLRFCPDIGDDQLWALVQAGKEPQPEPARD